MIARLFILLGVLTFAFASSQSTALEVIVGGTGTKDTAGDLKCSH